jgi:hypothetical protein
LEEEEAADDYLLNQEERDEAVKELKKQLDHYLIQGRHSGALRLGVNSRPSPFLMAFS